MATKRIKDLTNTATSVASDAYLAIDGTSNGTEKITRDNFRQDTANAFVAAPGTYNLAPLVAGAVEVSKGGTGATTAAGARTNLEVDSSDEIAESTGTKIVGPSLSFDGTNDYLEVSDDDKLSFTDSVNDLPFSVSGWIKMTDATRFCIAGKWNGSDEWLLYVTASDYLQFATRDSGSDITSITSNAALTSYEGQWIHVAATYGGAGPSAASGAAFTANMSGGNAALFINGVPVAATALDNASYGGMSNLSSPVWLGRYSSNYAEGSIRGVKIFNRELTASEVAELARGNDLGFSEEWGGAFGGAYTSDFSAGVDGFVAYGGVGVGNIDSIGGKNDNLRFTIDSASANHQFQKNYGSLIEDGKSVRVNAEIYIPSTNTQITGVQINRDGTANVDVIDTVTATNAWTAVSGVFTKDYPDIRFRALAGTAAVFVGNGSDVFYVRNIRITQIGTLADFRAEDYNESASKLLDRSSNNFVGVGTSVTLTGNQRHISVDTIDLKNLPTSSAGLSAGEVWSNGGVLTVV